MPAEQQGAYSTCNPHDASWVQAQADQVASKLQSLSIKAVAYHAGEGLGWPCRCGVMANRTQMCILAQA
jgi:hypothetical protein